MTLKEVIFVFFLSHFSKDADFFNPSYTVAAHTGNYVWEGCWVFVDFLKESLGEKIKGKKIIGILDYNNYLDSLDIFLY
ncbi:hypothetical protein M1146_04845 [Patescibacteria group bacterium]|nr:hypothetical protein [Patescibacteria group bacterium]